MSFKPVYTRYGALKKENGKVVLVKGYNNFGQLMSAEESVTSFLRNNGVIIKNTNISLKNIADGFKWILRIYVEYRGE